MKLASWLDHLPPWLAWGSIATTGTYGPLELLFMAAPLLLAAGAQACGASLHRWRRLIEGAALAGFLAHVLARSGLLPTVVHTLFLLCGARLSLPREAPQRRQILLMGFLLFLTTAITTSELPFLLWAVAWTAGAAAVLLQQSWGRPPRGEAPPFRLLFPWTLLALLLAAGFFVTLPRLRLGFRGLPGGAPGVRSASAGLSEELDLHKQGPIEENSEVALRVVPSPEGGPQGRARFAQAAGLLRCFVLEELEGRRWVLSAHPYPRPRNPRPGPGRPLEAECYLEPDQRRAVPLPYGTLDVEAAPGEEIHLGRGGAVAFAWPSPRTTVLGIRVGPFELQREPAPTGSRLASLLDPGPDNGAALRWSLAEAPESLPPKPLADRLSGSLSTFRYTLENPSGGAANPLADFLERTRAGHCEYFASALAVMLRHRGVPARVACGYRLGPWSPAGGYFLVTQAQAHAWVEYYDAPAGGWRVADPTPGGRNAALSAGPFGGAFTRWTDALRFAWDRHVVNFSGQTQNAGLAWLQSKVQRLDPGALPRPRPRHLAAAAVLLALAAGLLALRRSRTGKSRLPGLTGSLPELAPLVRAARSALPPGEGETARNWLLRMAKARPERAAELARLSEEADARAYGGRPSPSLKAMARTEARAWRKGPRN